MKILSFFQILAVVGVQGTKSMYEGAEDFTKTVFVFELIRHGARSHNGNVPVDLPKDYFG